MLTVGAVHNLLHREELTDGLEKARRTFYFFLYVVCFKLCQHHVVPVLPIFKEPIVQDTYRKDTPRYGVSISLSWR